MLILKNYILNRFLNIQYTHGIFLNFFQDIRFKKVILNCMSNKSSKEIFTSVAESLNLMPGRTKKDLIQQIEKALTSSKVPM